MEPWEPPLDPPLYVLDIHINMENMQNKVICYCKIDVETQV